MDYPTGPTATPTPFRPVTKEISVSHHPLHSTIQPTILTNQATADPTVCLVSAYCKFITVIAKDSKVPNEEVVLGSSDDSSDSDTEG